jgi:hypothetical protein
MRRRQTIVLDYGDAADPRILANLSGAASAGDYLWTVADEGRTVECLRRKGAGFVIESQVGVDDLVAGVPGRRKGSELDLESIDVAGGALWLCGSHSRVRHKPRKPGLLDSRLRPRPSRQLLAACPLARGRTAPGKGTALPVAGRGSLRSRLRANPYVAPFLGLPSKENGFDIEGFAVRGKRLFLGLRGPVVDSIAVVIELSLDSRFAIATDHTHLVDLQGLGVRDLANTGGHMLVLAGPVGDAPGPFRLLRWTPRPGERIQTTDVLFEWPLGTEKPEAVCPLRHSGKAGLLILYDNPDDSRVTGGKYAADWMPMP